MNYFLFKNLTKNIHYALQRSCLMMNRQPAVAGTFYPADPQQLQTMVEQYLNDAGTKSKVPKAIIAPHAGFIYSGPIAASAYARLLNWFVSNRIPS